MFRAFAVLLIFAVLNLVDRLVLHDDLGGVNVFGFAWAGLSVCAWCGTVALAAAALARRARVLLAPLFAFVFSLTVLQLAMRRSFDMILSGNWVGIVLSSSVAETITFLRGILGWGTVGALLIAAALLAAGTVSVWKMSGWAVPLRVRIAAAAVVVVILAGCGAGAPRFALGGGSVATLAVGTFTDTFGYARLKALRDRPVIAGDIRFGGLATDPPLVVFVLGESATRRRWSLYGYGRETTPRMDALRDELVVFTSVRGSAANTAEAMKYLLSEADREHPFRMNCSLMQVLAAAGYHGVLFSNQIRWGEFGGVESYLFSGARKQVYMCESGHPAGGFDEVLLPYLDGELSQSEGRSEVVFLHLMGSHSPSPIRYPADRARFAPEPLVKLHGATNPQKTSNHYDNSIVYTDWILGEIVDSLKATARSAAMIYITDHGESVDSDHWRKVSDPALWELPMIGWFSEEWRKSYPESVAEFEREKDRPWESEDLMRLLERACLVHR